MIPHLEEEGPSGPTLIGPDGSRWRQVAGWLDPSEVEQLISQGVMLVVSRCSGWGNNNWDWDATLDSQLMERVVTADVSDRLARKKKGIGAGWILVASLWERDDGTNRLVRLDEDAPKRRRWIEELRGM